MSDQNDVPTKPLPVTSDAVPTEVLAEPLAAQTVPIATPPAAVTMPRDRSWVAPLLIGAGLVVLLVLGVAVLPRLLAGEVTPAPSSTPTAEVPTEEAPPPVEDPPQPTEEPPIEPSPEPTP